MENLITGREVSNGPFLGSMLPQYMALCVGQLVSQSNKKF